MKSVSVLSFHPPPPPTSAVQLRGLRIQLIFLLALKILFYNFLFSSSRITMPAAIVYQDSISMGKLLEDTPRGGSLCA